jgi:hypothetical protein
MCTFVKCNYNFKKLKKKKQIWLQNGWYMLKYNLTNLFSFIIKSTKILRKIT